MRLGGCVLYCTVQYSVQYSTSTVQCIVQYSTVQCTVAEVHLNDRNGCGPAPEHCGYTPDKKDKFWRNKSHVIEPTLDTRLFWESMRRKYLERKLASQSVI